MGAGSGAGAGGGCRIARRRAAAQRRRRSPAPARTRSRRLPSRGRVTGQSRAQDVIDRGRQVRRPLARTRRSIWVRRVAISINVPVPNGSPPRERLVRDHGERVAVAGRRSRARRAPAPERCRRPCRAALRWRSAAPRMRRGRCRSRRRPAGRGRRRAGCAASRPGARRPSSARSRAQPRPRRASAARPRAPGAAELMRSAKRPAGEMLHHDEGPPGVLADVVDRHDVRMAGQRRGRTRLALEALTNCGCSANCSASTLIATARRSRPSSAAQIAAMPPTPIRRVTS